MPSLDESFAELERRLSTPALLDPRKGDPIFYLVYGPDEALEVKRRIPGWAARLGRGGAGYDVTTLSLSLMARRLIDESGLWHEWLASEPDFDVQDMNSSIQEVLADRLIEALRPLLTGEALAGKRPLLFITDVEMLHPYFRVHTVETQLHDRITAPTIVFYPGRRRGASGLSFLGIYPIDGNYRSTLIGGVP